MKPVLLSIFGVDVPAYFAMLVIGFSTAVLFAARGAKRLGLDGEVMADFGLAMAIWGVIGSRLLHVVADGYFWDYVHACTDPSLVSWHVSRAQCLSHDLGGAWDAAASVCHPRERNCFAWAAFWAGGLTFYGGLVAAAAYGVYFLRREKFPFWKAADLASFGIAYGLAWGRMGCFLAGCCFGRECALPWAVHFPAFSPASELHARTHRIASQSLPSLAVHPTQLYESIGSLVIAAVTYFVVYRRKRFDGEAILFSTVSYGVLRALLELLREDDRGGFLGVSTSQWISIGLIVACALVARRLRDATRTAVALAG